LKNEKISRFLHETGLLYRIEKPSRYIGDEYNSVKKDWETIELKHLLVFPDVYDIGMSHLGLKILYELINKEDDLLAERSFLPWQDLMDVMIEEEIPAFSLETFRPAKDFDVIGFTLQYELSYPGMVKYLDMANIPLYSEQRGEEDPIIMAGGPCVYNPEPVAPFVDAFLIGDGEEAIIEISDILKRSKHLLREERLLELSQLKGIYVPLFYEVDESGLVVPKKEYKGKVNERIKKRVAPLLKEYLPLKQLVPFMQPVHDRAIVEVLRGCTRGCRFCHAGMVYRPVRERSKEEIADAVHELIKNTGYEEISLLSLSTLDHSQIGEITDLIMPELQKNKISLSIPSSRVDKFGIEIAEKIASIRKTGLTIAPEAGTQSMRDRINKNVEMQNLIETIEAAKSKGWKRVKLYFMAGLPFETDEDLLGIAEVVKEVKKLGMRKISTSVSGFIPKPHTPFQYAQQASVDELHEKIKKLAFLKKFCQFEFHKPSISFIEGVLSRGDRKLAPVIEKIAEKGGYLESWKDKFSFVRWLETFEEFDIKPEDYTRARAFDEVFPWDHIDSGIRKEFLIEEFKKAEKGELTPDCRSGNCSFCGVSVDNEEAKKIIKDQNKESGGNFFDKQTERDI
jgi:radical SAM family uncharacterized protein